MNPFIARSPVAARHAASRRHQAAQILDLALASEHFGAVKKIARILSAG
jgi:hypothetical protein